MYYLVTAHSQCLMVVGRKGGLSTLCHNCRFAFQPRVRFPGPSYLRSVYDAV